jgi:hypothetical protein
MLHQRKPLDHTILIRGLLGVVVAFALKFSQQARFNPRDGDAFPRISADQPFSHNLAVDFVSALLSFGQGSVSNPEAHHSSFESRLEKPIAISMASEYPLLSRSEQVLIKLVEVIPSFDLSLVRFRIKHTHTS